MPDYRNLISAPELAPLLADPDCVVIDCRFDLMQPQKGRDEYLQGHIAGASYAHLDDDLAAPVTPESGRHPLPDIESFQACVRRWGIKAGTQVIAYDHANGATAARLWWLMRWAGHEKVAILDGGFAAWERFGGKTEREVPEARDTDYDLQVDSTQVLSTRELLDGLNKESALVLLDARDRKRYRGEIEPIDSVAGHVPGAINMPFMEMVTAEGNWRPPEELEQIWTDALDNGAEEALAAMCGSGVTACHLLVTAHLLGLPVPRLYVGSWSEWIREPERPVAVAD